MATVHSTVAIMCVKEGEGWCHLAALAEVLENTEGMEIVQETVNCLDICYPGDPRKRQRAQLVEWNAHTFMEHSIKLSIFVE